MSYGFVIVQVTIGVIYALIRRGAVHVLHAFKKTTQTTSQRHIELARARLKETTR